MLQVEKYGNFKGLGKFKKKKQIVLCHTSREVGEYLTSLKFRYNGRYDKIPHYVITKGGTVLQLLDEYSYTNFLFNEKTNQNSIVVCLENLGWLQRKPLSTGYINWNGSIYIDEVYEKKWRDYFFWAKYKEEQIETCSQLCNSLMDNLKIEKRFVGHNTKVDGVEKFEGIVTRSNFDSRYTDLNPSFDFSSFLKKIENEQYS